MKLFFCSMIFVGLKAFQQKNVQHNNYLAVIPVSLIMAFAEVAIVLWTVQERSFFAAIPIGFGAGLGCIFAMFIHGMFFNVARRAFSTESKSDRSAGYDGRGSGEDSIVDRFDE